MADLSPNERDLVIRTIIGEAGGEPPLGQAAVASVIRNRVQAGGYGDGVTGVITAPKQFSLWNQGNAAGAMARRVPISSPQYARVGAIVDSVFSGNAPDPTGGATHYYNPKGASPAWGPQLAQQNDVTIGNHRFVGSSEGPGRGLSTAPKVAVASGPGRSPSGPAAVPGTTITSVPSGPMITAGGPQPAVTTNAPNLPYGPASAVATSAPAPAPAPVVPPGQAFATAAQQGDIGGALKALTQKTGDPGQGKSPLESAASAMGLGQQQQQATAASQMLPPAPSPQMDMSMAPAAGQLLSQIIAQSQRPLTWASRPFGSGSAGPQIPGTTLSSGYGYG